MPNSEPAAKAAHEVNERAVRRAQSALDHLTLGPGFSIGYDEQYWLAQDVLRLARERDAALAVLEKVRALPRRWREVAETFVPDQALARFTLRDVARELAAALSAAPAEEEKPSD